MRNPKSRDGGREPRGPCLLSLDTQERSPILPMLKGFLFHSPPSNRPRSMSHTFPPSAQALLCSLPQHHCHSLTLKTANDVLWWTAPLQQDWETTPVMQVEKACVVPERSADPWKLGTTGKAPWCLGACPLHRIFIGIPSLEHSSISKPRALQLSTFCTHFLSIYSQRSWVFMGLCGHPSIPMAVSNGKSPALSDAIQKWLATYFHFAE